MLKRRNKNRRPIRESRRFSHKRFLNEDVDLPEDMRSALDREMAEAGDIPFVDDSFVDSLKVLPSFKPESVTVLCDFLESVTDYCKEEAYSDKDWETVEMWDEDDPHSKVVREDHWFGTGDYDSDGMETCANEYIKSSDPATQYIIDCAFLEGFYYKIAVEGDEDDWEEIYENDYRSGKITFVTD